MTGFITIVSNKLEFHKRDRQRLKLKFFFLNFSTSPILLISKIIELHIIIAWFLKPYYHLLSFLFLNISTNAY